MGTPPAVVYATLFYAIKEETFLDSYDSLIFYKRYIDDVFAIWIPNTDKDADTTSWSSLQSCMNDYHGLKWTFSPRSRTVDFLDMTVSIRGASLHTTLFEKLLNLYLYIPPHSAHPPGVLSGLVLGNCYRIYSICSDPQDIIHHLRRFYLRLKRRGYKQDKLLPLFNRAVGLYSRFTARQVIVTAPRQDNRIFFHLEYHPYNPKSSIIQRAWKRYIFHPAYEKRLTSLQNEEGALIPLDRLCVAYSRPRNLGNLLSYRTLTHNTAPSVSSTRITNNEGARERERERERVFGFAV